MQRARRHNPYPLTWEIPRGIACAILGCVTARQANNTQAMRTDRDIDGL